MAIFPREAINSGSSGQGFWCNVAAKDVVMALTELGIWQLWFVGSLYLQKHFTVAMELARRAKVWDLWFERLDCKIFSRAFYPMNYWVFLQSFWRRVDTKIEIGLFQRNHDNLDLCLEPSSQALFLQLLPLGYGRVMGRYYCYYYHQDLPLVSGCHYCKFDVCFEILIFTQIVKRRRGVGVGGY